MSFIEDHAPFAEDHTSWDTGCPPSVTWSTLERGLWVAHRGDALAGMIEQTPAGGYETTGVDGTVLGTFSTVAEARSTLLK